MSEFEYTRRGMAYILNEKTPTLDECVLKIW